MHVRPLVLSLAPLFAASLAHAQAPGQFEPESAPPGAAVAPPAAAPAPAAAPGGCGQPEARESVMANRWAVGFSIGQMGLAPESQPDNKTNFGVGELALRFRATPHLELELAVGGGREQLADNQQGDREVNTALLAARYRFRTEEAWNWFLMGGLGGASVTRHDATKQERDDAGRPMAMFGIGIERRFRHFALQAELHAIGVGEKKNDVMAVPPPAAVPGTTGGQGGKTTVNVPSAPLSPSEKQSGGALSIGLSYYF